MLGVLIQGASHFLAIIAIWFLFAEDRYPFIKVVMIFLPFIIAWVLVSFASITISGFRFSIYWIGTYLSKELYEYPNIKYAAIYVLLMVLIIVFQLHYGVIP